MILRCSTRARARPCLNSCGCRLPVAGQSRASPLLRFTRGRKLRSSNMSVYRRLLLRENSHVTLCSGPGLVGVAPSTDRLVMARSGHNSRPLAQTREQQHARSNRIINGGSEWESNPPASVNRKTYRARTALKVYVRLWWFRLIDRKMIASDCNCPPAPIG